VRAMVGTCLDDEAVAAGVLICNDSQWALNALKQSGHSSHYVLAPLRACLRGLKGRVCFQWVFAHCGLLGNERADEKARKAADLGPDDGAQRGSVPNPKPRFLCAQFFSLA
jgi:ribonuclease HI